MIYTCLVCQYSTPIKFNYQKHLKTKKHQTIISLNAPKNEGKNEENEENEQKNEGPKMKSSTEQNPKELLLLEKVPHFGCQFCGKEFSRKDNLRRHISVCKLNLAPKCSKMLQNAPKNVHAKITDSQPKGDIICDHCGRTFSRKSNLKRHSLRCKPRLNSQNVIFETSKKKGSPPEQHKSIQHRLLEQEFENKLLQKDLQHHQELLEHKQKLLDQKDQTIQIAKQSKQVIHNTTNKTINYLNNQYGGMIAMEQFLYNLEHTEQLTQEERQKLLMSYKDSGIELFARSFSHIMKENCRRQLLKEGLPEMDIIPLYCSDGNLRSHKEKGNQGWNTHYDDHSLNKMINISSDQVYESYQKSLMIFGKERNKVFKQIKQDNHSQNEDLKKITNK